MAAKEAGAGAASRLAPVAGPLRLELCTSHPASGPCSGLPGPPVGSWAGLQGRCSWGGGDLDLEAGAVLGGDWERVVELWGLAVPACRAAQWGHTAWDMQVQAASLEAWRAGFLAFFLALRDSFFSSLATRSSSSACGG